MWNKIIKWINKIALINVVTPRRALQAYLLALCEADIDGNGELNIKELVSATKQKCKFLIFSDDMTSDELHKLVDEILGEADMYDDNS